MEIARTWYDYKRYMRIMQPCKHYRDITSIQTGDKIKKTANSSIQAHLNKYLTECYGYSADKSLSIDANKLSIGTFSRDMIFGLTYISNILDVSVVTNRGNHFRL